MTSSYRICSRCIMDTTDPDIQFDEDGVCNHCWHYDEIVNKYVFTGEEGKQRLRTIIDEIKRKGTNKKYDCVIGVSGGVDSTYVAYMVKRVGLRPLAVHLDNGWDSELAVKNIENILKTLNIDLYTHVIDWEEFKDLQLAYLKASVVNIETPTDHAIPALLHKIANEKGIKYILTGHNIVTEGMLMPMSWVYNTNDLINLKAIHNRFGTVKLKTFPTLGLYRKLYYDLVKNIRAIPILNWVPYVRKDIKTFLVQELDWKDYGGKHYESIFTRFFQRYILPRKFNIDKRKFHLSILICSGQITREEALKEMQQDLFPESELKEEKEYFLKKLGLTNEEFEKIMNFPIKSHLDYKSDVKIFKFLRFIYKLLKLKRITDLWQYRISGRKPIIY